MPVDFGRLAKVTHTVSAKITVDGEEKEIQVRFRGASVRVQREMESSGAILDHEKGIVKPPEYLVAYGATLVSDGKLFTPDLEWWLDADPELLEVVFKAVNEGMSPPKPTPTTSETSSDLATASA